MAAIEDVDYLWENCEKQSYLLYIDSSKRDKRVYPHPSHYVLEFDKPFRFVFGYDILDAMIPTTMYNVEASNNTLVVGQVLSSRAGSQTGDLDLGIFDEFAFIPECERIVHAAENTLLCIVPQANLDSVGIVAHVAAQAPTDQAVWVTVTDAVSAAPDATLFDTPVTLGGDALYVPSRVAPAMEGRWHARVADGSVTFASLRYVDNIGYAMIEQTALYDVVFAVTACSIPSMNYDSRQLQQALNAALNGVGIVVTHGSAVPEQMNKYAWTAAAPFWLNFGASTCHTLLGFDELAPAADIADCCRVLPERHDPARRVFLSYFSAREQQHRVVSPNMLDLGGAPYVVLRVPELEEHAFAGEGSNANTVNGLGVFKLLAANSGMQNLRFDFTNLNRKPFHPIGKLTRLSIRLELKSGAPYDFKGVNHNILLVLKYLVPSVKSAAPRYNIRMLNSEYMPDAQQYALSRRRLLDEDDAQREPQQRSVQLPYQALDNIRGIISRVADAFKH